VIAALVAIVVAIGGCGDSLSIQPDGAWTGCGNVARATSVQVHRTAGIARPLVVTQHRAVTVRRLYYDLCVIVGHPFQPPGKPFSINCPAGYPLSYQGVFYAENRKLATFWFGVSGCSTVGLSVGSYSTDTMIMGEAAAAEPASFIADVAAVLGVHPAMVGRDPSLPGPPG
jgi:hypothetical protein